MKYWLHFIKYLWGKNRNQASCKIILWSATQSPMRSIILTANLLMMHANSIPTFALSCQNLHPSRSHSLLQAFADFGATWGMWKKCSFSCYLNTERLNRGRNLKAATQMLLPQCGRQSLLSLLSLKLENNLSDLCMEQHYVSFHCVRTFLLLKMLHLMEQLVLKATMFCFSSM